MHCETVILIGCNHCQREENMTIFSLQDLPKGGNYGPVTLWDECIWLDILSSPVNVNGNHTE